MHSPEKPAPPSAAPEKPALPSASEGPAKVVMGLWGMSHVDSCVFSCNVL